MYACVSILTINLPPVHWGKEVNNCVSIVLLPIPQCFKTWIWSDFLSVSRIYAQICECAYLHAIRSNRSNQLELLSWKVNKYFQDTSFKYFAGCQILSERKSFMLRIHSTVLPDLHVCSESIFLCIKFVFQLIQYEEQTNKNQTQKQFGNYVITLHKLLSLWS